ncbi:luciferase-like domain-containing protein [Aspergillus pseudoustus]|uniref:Luciferase-like domain-containing protein n=1 Tax=Aspergillus pseudoustus TaxID=1810923 RepID=A0ABR4IYK8_9EURO
MFLPGMHIDAVRKSVPNIRQTATEQGRDVNGQKLIVGMLVIIDETDELAQRKYDEYLSYAMWTWMDRSRCSGDDEDFQFTGPGVIQSIVSSWRAMIPGSDGIRWTKKRVAQELALGGPHPRAVGSAKTVADILEKWIAETDVDGFNISYAVGPGDLEDVVKYLVPELKARGVFWDPVAAEGETTRGTYLGDFARGSRLSSDHPGAKYRGTASDDCPLFAAEDTSEDISYALCREDILL